MSLPTEADFALIKKGDGAGPEVFAIICGLQDVTINQVANSTDRFVRDCAKPGSVPYRKTKATGLQLDVTGSGLTDKSHIDILLEALGKVGNFKIELYQDDGTDTGDLVGTFAAAFLLEASNLNIQRDGDSTSEITLKSNGAWTWTAAA